MGGSGIGIGLVLALLVGFLWAAFTLLSPSHSGEQPSRNAVLAEYVSLANGK